MGRAIPGNSCVDPQATNPRAVKRDKFGHVINSAKRSPHEDERTVLESRSYWAASESLISLGVSLTPSLSKRYLLGTGK